MYIEPSKAFVKVFSCNTLRSQVERSWDPNPGLIRIVQYLMPNTISALYKTEVN